MWISEYFHFDELSIPCRKWIGRAALWMESKWPQLGSVQYFGHWKDGQEYTKDMPKNYIDPELNEPFIVFKSWQEEPSYWLDEVGREYYHAREGDSIRLEEGEVEGFKQIARASIRTFNPLVKKKNETYYVRYQMDYFGHRHYRYNISTQRDIKDTKESITRPRFQSLDYFDQELEDNDHVSCSYDS